MLDAFIATICISITCSAFDRISQPGELLMYYVRWVNTTIENTLIKKILTCPWCIGGQISFWWGVYMVIGKQSEIDVFIAVPATILITYEIRVIK